MKAIVISSFGGPDVLQLRDVPDPIGGDDLLSVRVRAIGVNPVETYVREGKYATLPMLPFIPGTELAGEIDAGPRAGERIFALGTAGPSATGAYAERAVIHERQAHPLPAHLSFEQGAAVPAAFGTAWRALHDRGGLLAGQTVLIHGASGGVGSAAVQLAAAAGAVVIGTASTEAGQAAVREDGASLVVNHRVAGYRDEILRNTGGRGVHLIIEMLANMNLDHDLDLLAPGGRVVVVGNRGRIEIDPRKTMAKETTICGVTLGGAGEAAFPRVYAGIGALLARRALTPRVGQTFPLAQAADAQRAVMSDSGRTGKIVLIP